MLRLNEIYNIDCIEGLKKLDDNSVDLVVTFPPYYNAREYSQWESVDDYIRNMNNVFFISL